MTSESTAREKLVEHLEESESLLSRIGSAGNNKTETWTAMSAKAGVHAHLAQVYLEMLRVSGKDPLDA